MTVNASPVPAGLARCLDALDALSALLLCADEQLWRSMARPRAAGVGVLVQRMREDIGAEVEALLTDGVHNN